MPRKTAAQFLKEEESSASSPLRRSSRVLKRSSSVSEESNTPVNTQPRGRRHSITEESPKTAEPEKKRALRARKGSVDDVTPTIVDVDKKRTLRPRRVSVDEVHKESPKVQKARTRGAKEEPAVSKPVTRKGLSASSETQDEPLGKRVTRSRSTSTTISEDSSKTPTPKRRSPITSEKSISREDTPVRSSKNSTPEKIEESSDKAETTLTPVAEKLAKSKKNLDLSVIYENCDEKGDSSQISDSFSLIMSPEKLNNSDKENKPEEYDVFAPDPQSSTTRKQAVDECEPMEVDVSLFETTMNSSPSKVPQVVLCPLQMKVDVGNQERSSSSAALESQNSTTKVSSEISNSPSSKISPARGTSNKPAGTPEKQAILAEERRVSLRSSPRLKEKEESPKKTEENTANSPKKSPIRSLENSYNSPVKRVKTPQKLDDGKNPDVDSSPAKNLRSKSALIFNESPDKSPSKNDGPSRNLRSLGKSPGNTVEAEDLEDTVYEMLKFPGEVDEEVDLVDVENISVNGENPVLQKDENLRPKSALSFNNSPDKSARESPSKKDGPRRNLRSSSKSPMKPVELEDLEDTVYDLWKSPGGVEEEDAVVDVENISVIGENPVLEKDKKLSPKSPLLSKDSPEKSDRESPSNREGPSRKLRSSSKSPMKNVEVDTVYDVSKLPGDEEEEDAVVDVETISVNSENPVLEKQENSSFTIKTPASVVLANGPSSPMSSSMDFEDMIDAAMDSNPNSSAAVVGESVKDSSKENIPTEIDFEEVIDFEASRQKTCRNSLNKEIHTETSTAVKSTEKRKKSNSESEMRKSGGQSMQETVISVPETGTVPPKKTPEVPKSETPSSILKQPGKTRVTHPSFDVALECYDSETPKSYPKTPIPKKSKTSERSEERSPESDFDAELEDILDEKFKEAENKDSSEEEDFETSFQPVHSSDEEDNEKEEEPPAKSQQEVEAEKHERKSLNEKLDSLISATLEEKRRAAVEPSSSDGEASSEDGFLDSMAQEAEEDTPSDDSNEIIEIGDEINTTESEMSEEEDVGEEEDSLFIDDNEEETLLSGTGDDLSFEDRSKLKKSRILKVECDSDEELIKIERPQKKKPQKLQKSRILMRPTEDSTDEEEEEENMEPDSVKLSPSMSSSSKIIVHENINVDEIQSEELVSQIRQAVETLHKTSPQQTSSVNVSVHVKQENEGAEPAGQKRKLSESMTNISNERKKKKTTEMKRKTGSFVCRIDSTTSDEVFLSEPSPTMESENQEWKKKGYNKFKLSPSLATTDDNAPVTTMESKNQQRKKKRYNRLQLRPSLATHDENAKENLPSITPSTHNRKVDVGERKRKMLDEISARPPPIKRKKKNKSKKKLLEPRSPSRWEKSVMEEIFIETNRKKTAGLNLRVGTSAMSVSRSWDVKRIAIQPSTSNTLMEIKPSTSSVGSKEDPRDFRNKAIYGQNRLGTKDMLKKRGVYL